MREEDMDFNPHYEFAKGGKLNISKAELIDTDGVEYEIWQDSKTGKMFNVPIERLEDDSSGEPQIKRYLKEAVEVKDFAKGGELEANKTFEIGGIVRISEDNDNENYDDFRGKDLRIVSVAYDTSDHFGYDESMDGMALYDLEVADTGEDVPFSLYEYEVEIYAKGGKTKEMYFIETGMNTKSGEKKYTYEQGIKRIKSLLKDDKDLLGGRKLSSLSDDDIIELGFNHYGFDYADNYAKGGRTNDKVSKKIRLLKKEGYPHDQAVAIALSMRDSNKLAKGGKVYKVGDVWSEDFDYDGMLEYGRNINEKTPLRDLLRYRTSLQDVNYHTLAAPFFDLEAAIKEDKSGKIKHFVKKFKRKLNDEFRSQGKKEMTTKEIYLFEKGGFIQEAVKEMKEKGTTGSFTKQAKNAGMTTTAFAKKVLNNPKKFTEKTRKRAIFMKNTNPEKFDVGGEIVRAYDVNINSGVGTYARGGKAKRRKQGYNAQLDESLGMRRGAKRTKQQSDKDRRDEAKAMNKAMGRRAYASVRGMDKGRRKMAKGGKVNKKLILLQNRFSSQLRTLELLSREKYLYNDKDELYIKRLRSNIDTLAELGKEIEEERYGFAGVGIFATGGKITMAGDTDFPSELLNYGKGGVARDRKFASQEKHEKAYAPKRKKPFKRYKGRK